MIHKQKTRKEN